MRSVVVTFIERFQAGRNLLLALNVEGVTEKLTATLLEDCLRITLDGEITIFDLFHLTLFYRTLLNKRFQRIFVGKLLFLSIDIQMNDALPTMWSSGTKPQ